VPTRKKTERRRTTRRPSLRLRCEVAPARAEALRIAALRPRWVGEPSVVWVRCEWVAGPGEELAGASAASVPAVAWAPGASEALGEDPCALAASAFAWADVRRRRETGRVVPMRARPQMLPERERCPRARSCGKGPLEPGVRSWSPPCGRILKPVFSMRPVSRGLECPCPASNCLSAEQRVRG
jgi:hypothetical protein